MNTEAEILQARIQVLEAENAAMRHDLEATQGLWALDRQTSEDQFQIEHWSLLTNQQRYEYLKANDLLTYQEYSNPSAVGWAGWYEHSNTLQVVAYRATDTEELFFDFE